MIITRGVLGLKLDEQEEHRNPKAPSWHPRGNELCISNIERADALSSSRQHNRNTNGAESPRRSNVNVTDVLFPM
jgi:hypothetical protein